MFLTNIHAYRSSNGEKLLLVGLPDRTPVEKGAKRDRIKRTIAGNIM